MAPYPHTPERRAVAQSPYSQFEVCYSLDITFDPRGERCDR